ncbi:molybdopterin synthase [Powellomyces hirtus]|uniref:Molybdopterin synthase n=1 Tax=Powellomyces hirtus TaxID=109895 RepID=A0A507DW71_9FUNG|nr:molybdopterin synthase [Powellomyces hirtus]
MAFRQENERDFVEVIAEPPSLTKLVEFVRSEEAGAIATFSGTTRNSFVVNGVSKRVVHLSYEAYVPMAISQLHVILTEARARWPALIRLAVSHRTGTVPVAQESVIIAASSPQRKDALAATGWILDELKSRVPIWKMEYYDDGSMWKENGECAWAAGKTAP